MPGYGVDRYGIDPYGTPFLVSPPGGTGGVPLPGATPPLIAYPDELPPLVHVVRGPTGLSDYPELVDRFSATEVNGFESLEGAVEADRARDMPEVYTDGAQWLVFDTQSGELVAAGDLFSPGITGGRAVLRADGWGKRLRRQVTRYLLQNKRYGDWSESTGDPLTLQKPGGGADEGDSVIQVDAQGGRLLYSVPQGTDVNTNDLNRLAFWAQGARVQRLAFHWRQRFDNGLWTIRVHSTVGPGGELVQQTNVPMSGFSGDVDVDVSGVEDDGNLFDLVTIALLRSGASGTSDGYWLKLTDVRVNDIAVGDTFTFGDIALDIAGRAGFVPDVVGASLNALPLDLIASTFADALDYGAGLEDQRWAVVGRAPSTPVLQTRSWDDEVWELLDPEFPFEPIPLPQYDEIQVPFQYPNSSAVGYVTVTAPVRLPIPRSYGQIGLTQPTSEDAAQVLGERLLSYLSQPRFAGQVSFTRGVVNGEVRSSHLFHGGAVKLPQGITCRVKSFTRDPVVTATLDDAVAPVDRLLLQQNQKAALRGR